ncbi:B12-binding domain-containing radical SAM protein [Lachnospiraceae bacterium SGI.066]
MKRFLLLNSPIFWDTIQEKEQYLSPLGLGYIATYLEKNGINIEMMDCVKNRVAVKDILNYISKTKPDYLGINIFTQNYDIVKYIIENTNIQCELFIGGQVVKSIYKEILQWKVNNTVNIIIGEGELIIPDIVLEKCIQNPEIKIYNKYVFRVNEESKYLPRDISSIVLNRRFLKDEVIINHYGDEEGAIITSRGCIFDCAFCGGARSLNKDVPIRVRGMESIVKEIESLLQIYPSMKSIRILDDLFLRNKESINMAYSIFSKFPHLYWRGMAHVLILKNSMEKLEKLKACNCKELFVGIESGSDNVRKKINKLGSTQDVISVSKAILEMGIDLKGYFIYGFPNEKEDDFKRTYELAMEIKKISQETSGNFRTSVFQFRPYHGTKLYKQLKHSTGILHGCKINKEISKFNGRTQFNFDFGNYSSESDKVLNDYIIKTQRLMEKND